MIKKYEYEEFLNMVKQDLENQEKSNLLPFSNDKETISIVYRLLSARGTGYIDTPVELDDKYHMWLWSKTYKQIEVLFPDLSIEQVLSVIRYVRTKFIYDEAKRLLNLFRLILPIPSEAIPDDSILREFIGGSCFHD